MYSKKCIDIIQSVKTEFSDSDKEMFGKFPHEFIIDYGTASKGEMRFQINDIIESWCYKDEKLNDNPTKRRRQPKPYSGMFFYEGFAEFSYDKERNKAYIDLFFGRLFARGFCFDIEKQNDTYVLTKQEVLWVS